MLKETIHHTRGHVGTPMKICLPELSRLDTWYKTYCQEPPVHTIDTVTWGNISVSSAATVASKWAVNHEVPEANEVALLPSHGPHPTPHPPQMQHHWTLDHKAPDRLGYRANVIDTRDRDDPSFTD